jgi:sulfur carrier protein
MSDPQGPASIRLQVNGAVEEVPAGTTIEGLLTRLGLGPTPRGVAVAVGDEVVRRGAWPERALTEGDRVEIVTAVQGG